MRTVLSWLDTLAAIALLIMMALTVADVVGRYVIGRPLPGAIELVQYAMVLVVFTGLPVVTHRRKHISLGMLDRWLGNSARVWHQRLVDLSSAIVLAVIAWILFNAAGVPVPRVHGDAEEAQAHVVEPMPVRGDGLQSRGAARRAARHEEAEHDVAARHRVEDVVRVAGRRGPETGRGIAARQVDEALFFHRSAPSPCRRCLQDSRLCRWLQKSRTAEEHC